MKLLKIATLIISTFCILSRGHAEYVVKEVGSFYIGGHEKTVSGEPIAEISTSPEMRPFKCISAGRVPAFD
jgi:hypothetical protein